MLQDANAAARILVVEDQLTVARDVQQQLVALGYQPVGHCTSADAAIMLAGELRPNLVLMDINLDTNMDGIAAATEIHNRFNLPVVFLSALAADDTLARAKLSEPFGYILKPFCGHELHNTIEMALYRHQIETKLREQAQYTQTILDEMLDGVITINAQGQIGSANQAALTLFGYSADELLGQNVKILMPEPQRSAHDGYLLQYQQTGEARVLGNRRELTGRHKDGSEFPMSLSAAKAQCSGQPLFIGVIRDISEQYAHAEEIRRLAFFDPLTGLANRRLMDDRLNHALTQAIRNNRSMALMFLDIDDFKPINDTLGHDMGDQLLISMAQRLTLAVRSGDTVSRSGGDEFIIVLPEISDPMDAGNVAEKILHALQQPFKYEEHTLHVSMSIGIAIYPLTGANNARRLMQKADEAMYEAKRAGHNQYKFCCNNNSATTIQQRQ